MHQKNVKQILYDLLLAGSNNGKHFRYCRTQLVSKSILMCLSIGTPKTSNFPFVPNGKLTLFRCSNIYAHKGTLRSNSLTLKVPSKIAADNTFIIFTFIFQ